MMNKIITGFTAGLLVFGTAGISQATLTTIGTAQFSGNSTEYKLILDDDNNGNSVVWLDYTNFATDWDSQMSWAAGLNTSLTLNIDPTYTIDWGTNSWRLPETYDHGQMYYGDDGSIMNTYGYNITSSEIGHLYYEELGNLGFHDFSGEVNPTGWGLQNTEDFNNLYAPYYWSSTEVKSNPGHYWAFATRDGFQGISAPAYEVYGLALRTVQLDSSPVPVPGALWLLGSGIAGLMSLSRRRKNKG